MRLLADENVHGRVVAALRARSHRLDWVKEIARGAKDTALLALPDMVDRIFITNDRDFGELVFRHLLPPPLAILYTRTAHRDWELTASLLETELAAGVVPAHITTLTKDGIRRRPFPIGVPHD